MGIRHVRATALGIMLVALLAFSALPVAGQHIGHLGKNRLEFAPVDPDSLPDAKGTGIVDYKGGTEPSSQWRASLRFTGLQANVSYTVVTQGQFGPQGSQEAEAFTPLCAFTTDDAGVGSCFWYFRGLARLDLVQLRAGDDRGSPVLEATRGRGRGSIETTPNRFSPGGEISRQQQARNNQK
ncbi:MAG TPA: hypothetical protein VEZ12_02690 [Herpetosiphonaceae bacterium]|nr:hypothetical protein [Herpetosiphonaceae bacterium]